MISALCMTTHAAVPPGGTFPDKAIFVEAGGGETLAAAPGAAAAGAAAGLLYDSIVSVFLHGPLSTNEIVSSLTRSFGCRRSG